MRLLADLHTHSNNCRFFHGKNKIEEMVLAANEAGLQEIAITDHGYKHFFRTSKAKLKEARKVINEINEWSKTKVLLGIEADIISEDGTLDIDTETLALLDVLVVGYHRMIHTNFAGYFGNVSKTEEAKRKCTNAFVNAINRYPVTIVSHLDSILTTDLYEVGKACKERGTMVEINNRHTNWTQDEVDQLLASDCMFVVSSDAHSREAVGSVSNAFELIKKYNIPSENVVNVEFEEFEKSESDRIYSAYASVYEKVEKEKKQREDVIVEKKKSQFSGALSDEMEKALSQIAQEKGIEMSGPKTYDTYEEYMRAVDEADQALIAQAEEYLRSDSIGEFDRENESINFNEELSEKDNLRKDEDLYQFDDDHPLVAENSEFEKRTMSVQSLIDSEPQKNTTSVADESTNKKENVQVKVEPENFMASITQTKLASVVKSEPKLEEKPKPAPATKKRNGPGAFVVIDDLINKN